MTNQSRDNLKDVKKRDPDLIGAEAAMKRAARKARERARQAGIGVVVMKNGKIVEERQDLQQP
jgi:LDH2 family malate/lactate/ureidoglycolate dehydrogenase